MKVIKISVAQIADATLLADTPYELVLKRHLRVPLLEAFDIHKSNIAYGVETETDAERASCIAWYRRLLDLDTDAIVNPPPCVSRHVRTGGATYA